MKSLNKAQRSQVVFRHQVHGVSRKKAKERFKIKEANKEIKEYNKEIKEYNWKTWFFYFYYWKT